MNILNFLFEFALILLLLQMILNSLIII